MEALDQLLYHWTAMKETDVETVPMTKGGETIYVPASQQDYFASRGWTAEPTKKTTPKESK